MPVKIGGHAVGSDAFLHERFWGLRYAYSHGYGGNAWSVVRTMEGWLRLYRSAMPYQERLSWCAPFCNTPQLQAALLERACA